ncbi:uncharacterized protein ACRADG_012138 [Cochliomyia hominivorax]
MKCCSRSTLGVVIGVLNIIIYIIAVIVLILASVEINGKEPKNYQQENAIRNINILFIVLVIVCLIMILISGLLVTGILKRRHKLMLPWIILSIIGFVINCLKLGFDIVLGLIKRLDLSEIVIHFLLGLLGIVISGLIIKAIYDLYKDIREENTKKIGRVLNAAPVNYYKSDNI